MDEAMMKICKEKKKPNFYVALDVSSGALNKTLDTRSTVSRKGYCNRVCQIYRCAMFSDALDITSDMIFREDYNMFEKIHKALNISSVTLNTPPERLHREGFSMARKDYMAPDVSRRAPVKT
jgi:hypothetical protein